MIIVLKTIQFLFLFVSSLSVYDIVEKCQQSRGVVDMPFWFPSGLTEEMTDDEEGKNEVGEDDEGQEEEDSEETSSSEESGSSEEEDDSSGTCDSDSEEECSDSDEESASESEYSEFESSKYYPQVENWVGNVDSTAVNTTEGDDDDDGDSEEDSDETLEYSGSETETEYRRKFDVITRPIQLLENYFPVANLCFMTKKKRKKKNLK